LKRKREIAWSIAGGVLIALGILILVRIHHWRPRSITIQGAVVREDSDTRKQSPIIGAKVIATDGVTSTTTQSDASGYYKITFPEEVWPGHTLILKFSHPDYQPTDLKLPTGLRLASKGLYIADLEPILPQIEKNSPGKLNRVTNIRVRYTVNSQSEDNIGSAVRTFEVVNKANVPCNGQPPCSPDGSWKASSASVSLDAGPDNEFRSVRASCIAGPCPFTRIDSSGFVNGGRTVRASAVDWSDTATFLLEAEVFRVAMTSRVRYLYPVFFGDAMHFTLPPTQEGVSLEADVEGVPMVFPLGPELYLSWATCSVRTTPGPDKATVYQCELKKGYRF
jgi:hypothetical protein